jgi:hypothetical protein
MSKSDVSKPRASNPKQQIVLTFEDALPVKKDGTIKSDGTIKIKNVSEFLGADITNLKIFGHNTYYAHNNDTHHELTFIIKDKKTKAVDKFVIDFVQKQNQKKFKGVVSLLAEPASFPQTTGTQATAVLTDAADNRCSNGEIPFILFGICVPAMTITLEPKI